MTASTLSKYKWLYTIISPRNLSQFQCFPYRRDLSFSFRCGRGCSSHRKMISMRRGLWGKDSRQNQIPREIFQNFLGPTTVATVSSSTEITDEQMPAPEETTCSGPPTVKRAKFDTDMPINTAVMPPVLLFAKLSEHAQAPKKGTELAAGYDLYSAQDCVIRAQGKDTVMTDIQIELPQDCYGRIAPRSGLARKNHIDVGAGVIDRDYRGNVGVVMFNHSKEDFKVEKGDRIAQLICERIFYPELQEVKELSETERGSSGYGSTGAK